MGAKLKAYKLKPDVIIASNAKRTKQTAKRIAEAVGYDTSLIKWEEKLYHCIPSVFEETLYELDNDVKTVFIVAHNPGITEFVNQLSPSFNIDNMPTCGIVAVSMDMKEWNQFATTAKRKVFLFDYPGKES